MACGYLDCPLGHECIINYKGIVEETVNFDNIFLAMLTVF